jgi:hypothetical protein
MSNPHNYVEDIKLLYKHSLDKLGLKPKMELPDVIQ